MYSTVPVVSIISVESTINGDQKSSNTTESPLLIEPTILSQLPEDASNTVVNSVVKNIVCCHKHKKTPSENVNKVEQMKTKDEIDGSIASSPIQTETQINWLMDVICYGLTLPLTQHDTIKDCVNVYCNWLSVFCSSKKEQSAQSPFCCIPSPILQDPNFFGRKMFLHLYQLFVPRSRSISMSSSDVVTTSHDFHHNSPEVEQDLIHKQAVLCHRVLRRVQSILIITSSLRNEDSASPHLIDEKTCESLLVFLLSINDAILSPPTVKDDVGEQLCERVLSALFEIWLTASSSPTFFPTPSLWKTLTTCAIKWRHRRGTVVQWFKVCWALTRQMLDDFKPRISVKYESESLNAIVSKMESGIVRQCFYRILHCLGDITDLANPKIISSSQPFYQYALRCSDVVDPTQHPCLSSHLPMNFAVAMHGLASLCDANLSLTSGSSVYTQLTTLSNNMADLKLTKPQPVIRNGESSMDTLSEMTVYAKSNRSRVDSILNLFGKWLFKGASQVTGNSPSSSSFIEGRCHSLGALCRIFGSKRPSQSIHSGYIVKFYSVLINSFKYAENLNSTSNRETKELVLFTILINCHRLFTRDLIASTSLIPYFTSAIEYYVNSVNSSPSSFSSQHQTPRFDPSILRRSCILNLLAISGRPMLSKKPVDNDTNNDNNDPVVVHQKSGGSACCFKTILFRLVDISLSLIQSETDVFNIQMLLGSLSVCLSQIFTSTCKYHACTSCQFLSNKTEVTLDKSCQVVSLRLISTWKCDLNSSLVALEFLSSVAPLSECGSSDGEGSGIGSKADVIGLVCEYIAGQCSRPRPAHTKDLHSSIVAAFRCLQVWVAYKPQCITSGHKQYHPQSHKISTLTSVMEVIELGITGSKSDHGEKRVPKGEKMLTPVSRRVHDAAQNLLTTIMTQMGSERSDVSTSFDEKSLLKDTQFFKENYAESSNLESVHSRFRHFIVDNSFMLSILEFPLLLDDNKHDSEVQATILLRSVHGRFAWHMSLQLNGRERPPARRKACGKMTSSENSALFGDAPLCFPTSIQNIPKVKADYSLPQMNRYMSYLMTTKSKLSDDYSPNHNAQDEFEDEIFNRDEIDALFEEVEVRGRKEQQMHAVNRVKWEKESIVIDSDKTVHLKHTNGCDLPKRIVPSRNVKFRPFQTSRLILSHFGWLKPSLLLADHRVGGENGDFSGGKSSFDHHEEKISSSAANCSDLPSLVSLDVFASNSVTSSFIQDLHILDHTPSRLTQNVLVFHPPLHVHVEVNEKLVNFSKYHLKFLLTNLGDSTGRSRQYPADSAGKIYWSDPLSEVCFDVSNLACSTDKSLSQHSEGVEFIVVWLDVSYEDYKTPPLRTILPEFTNDTGSGDQTRVDHSSLVIIYLQPIAETECLIPEPSDDNVNKKKQDCLILVRVKNFQPVGSNLPLVDNLTLPLSLLPSLLIETVSRRRQSDDSGASCQKRRLLQIRELGRKYRARLSPAEFYANLFSDVCGFDDNGSFTAGAESQH